MARNETTSSTASDVKLGTAPAAAAAANGSTRKRSPNKPKAPVAVYVLVQLVDATGASVKPEGELRVTVAANAHAAIEMQKANPGATLAFGYTG